LPAAGPAAVSAPLQQLLLAQVRTLKLQLLLKPLVQQLAVLCVLLAHAAHINRAQRPARQHFYR
jgi:hypothetical protein